MRWAGRCLDAALGALVLVAAHVLLAPVPLSAATSWAFGIVCVWLELPQRGRWVSLAAVGGALVGATAHAGAHLAGRSTVPAEGLPMHLLTEAVLGLAVGAIAIAASAARLVFRPRGTA